MQQEKNSFHNTIGIICQPLEKAEKKAVTQEDKIYNFFYRKAGKEFTPCEIMQALTHTGVLPKATPITSIRRAISNLTKAKKLIKTNNQRPGYYGTLNFTWKLNGEVVQGELFN